MPFRGCFRLAHRSRVAARVVKQSEIAKTGARDRGHAVAVPRSVDGVKREQIETVSRASSTGFRAKS